MFKNTIKYSDIGRDVAVRLTNNIFGDDYNGDISFVATLKALLYQRLSPEETYQFKKKLLVTTRESLAGEVLKRDVPPIGNSDNCFTVCYFSGPGNFHVDGPDLAAKIFGESHPEYRHYDRVDKFFEKSFKTITYISDSRRSVVIFVGWLFENKFHYLQASIIPCMPWFFQKDNLTQEDLDIAHSFNKKDKDVYINAIQRAYKKIESEYSIFAECPMCGIRCLNPSEYDSIWICDSCGEFLSSSGSDYKIVHNSALF